MTSSTLYVLVTVIHLCSVALHCYRFISFKKKKKKRIERKKKYFSVSWMRANVWYSIQSSLLSSFRKFNNVLTFSASFYLYFVNTYSNEIFSFTEYKYIYFSSLCSMLVLIFGTVLSSGCLLTHFQMLINS